MNGVATFVRNKAFGVVRASSRPLGEKELDDEGRCVLTDHGTFVLFNAYVPNGSGGKRLAYKLRWLTALRRSMAAVAVSLTWIFIASKVGSPGVALFEKELTSGWM